jgi:hypothetical protein
MPIKVNIETKNESFPDTGDAKAYLEAVQPVLDQVGSAIRTFAVERIDRVTPLKDVKGQVCGSVEILRF